MRDDFESVLLDFAIHWRIYKKFTYPVLERGDKVFSDLSAGGYQSRSDPNFDAAQELGEEVNYPVFEFTLEAVGGYDIFQTMSRLAEIETAVRQLPKPDFFKAGGVDRRDEGKRMGRPNGN